MEGGYELGMKRCAGMGDMSVIISIPELELKHLLFLAIHSHAFRS